MPPGRNQVREFLAGVHRSGCGLFVVVVVAGIPGQAAQSDGSSLEFFENRIRPVLVEHCYECHSSRQVKGGLQVDSREALLQGGDGGPAIVPGDPGKSLLLRAVRHEDPDLAMPAKKPKLSPGVIADLEEWIRQGAPFPSEARPVSNERHWAFQPVRDPVPPVIEATWSRTSVDDFVLAKLREHGTEPAPAADRRTLLRRATYDLTGLPPSAGDVDAFERDASADAFAKVVERLLASPQYGERWGRHWLDLVRYADTAGETADYPVPAAWRYRDWVIEAFNSDLPYDEFLREQIAGDILARRGPPELYAGRVTATGYLAISRRFGFDSENYHHLTIQDTIDTLGQSVLGLTLGCARCHAHKFDPVSTSDYYALYGIFESTRYAFPGSEQKQKTRSLVPLLPPRESQRRWREFDVRLASLAGRLDRQKQSVPAAVLRSLDDLDGDFELQAPAAGGSKGVLVPPWVYEGPIAVSTEAQSPFKNLHALGKVGVHVSPGTHDYRIAQAVHPARTRGAAGTLHLNLDFRVSTNEPASSGRHRFWIGSMDGSPAVEVLISPEALSMRTGERVESIRTLKPNEWFNVNLVLELKSGTISGKAGQPGDVVSIPMQPLSAVWNGTIDYLCLDSLDRRSGILPSIAIDNLGLEEAPIAPVAREVTGLVSAATEPDPSAVSAQLQQLVGMDGDFEGQTEGEPPAAPWGPGPNSVVTVRASAQSPFRNLFAPGALGVHMPNRGTYDGFGQTLTNKWKNDQTKRLFASFDFRCAGADAGGDGTWRFYLGHGPGSSAAVELFFNRTHFFRRSGDQREVVRSLNLGEWYQVQLALDLVEKRYTGVIAGAYDRSEFPGEFASGWDGSIDHTFIDSFGHMGGVRPALDADNFVIRETPLAAMDSIASQSSEGEGDHHRASVAELRRQIARLNDLKVQSKRELESLLGEGPVPLAYGVSEGTPRNARLQLRGDPDKPGDEVPRGFLKVLGGGNLPAGTRGSGRLELGEWLTRPENPLTARVMANRIWQYHFGQGVVKTPNDFGTRGQPPTDPELLDHLATQFIRQGWSVKAMHRLIMLSATYQQSASGGESPNGNGYSEPAREGGMRQPPPGGSKADVAIAGRFAPFVRRRLDAEEIRDSILVVSGELDLSPARGHPFPAPPTWGYTQHGPFSGVYDHDRRSVYLMTQRIKRHPFLALFDGADPNASTAARGTTTVPTQALFFLNDPFIHDKSVRFAARVERLGAGESERIDAAYRLALGRSPTGAERAEAAEFLAAYRAELKAANRNDVERGALAAFGRVLFGSNEFLTVD